MLDQTLDELPSNFTDSEEAKSVAMEALDKTNGIVSKLQKPIEEHLGPAMESISLLQGIASEGAQAGALQVETMATVDKMMEDLNAKIERLGLWDRRQGAIKQGTKRGARRRLVQCTDYLYLQSTGVESRESRGRKAKKAHHATLN